MSNIQIEIGQRIRQLRLETGLSQEKFALSIGMDRTYFASVENGKRNISIVNLEKIINGLNTSLSINSIDCNSDRLIGSHGKAINGIPFRRKIFSSFLLTK